MSTLENDGNLDRATEIEGYKVLPPCVIYGKIGQGGMGAVYRGRHLNLDIDVAVKCLKPGLVGSDDQFVVRFRREGRLAAQINHQNVIRVYDVAEDQGLHYLIMELVQGETARERVVRKGRLKVGEALEIVYEAALGLAEAHRKGFIHRDIKPDNIMISSSGQVKVADLGLAKPSIRDENASMLSGTNLVMGTPQYMPPEQWENTTTVTSAADVWALGATLYYLLVGGEAIQKDSLPRVMQRILLQPFPDPRIARPDVPEDVALLIAKATSTAVQDRYQDAQEMADAISALHTRRESLRDKAAAPTSHPNSLVSPPPAQTLAKIKFWLDKQGQEPGGTQVVPPPRAEGPQGTVVVPRQAETVAQLPPQRRGIVVWIVAAVVLVAVALLGYLQPWQRASHSGTGIFAEADRLEGIGSYEAAIEEANRVHVGDPSLPGKADRLARLCAAWSRDLAVRGEWKDALLQIERSLGHRDSPSVREQKRDLLDRIARAVDGKLLRERPAGQPVPRQGKVQFAGRLDEPVVTALRIGGVLVERRSGAFEVSLDVGGNRQVPVEATLTSGEVLALQPWSIVYEAAQVVHGPVVLRVEPESLELEDDKEAELTIRVAKDVEVSVDGVVLPRSGDGTLYRHRVRSREDEPKPVVVVGRQDGYTETERTVAVRRSMPALGWIKVPEIVGGKAFQGHTVVGDTTVRIVGQLRERGAEVWIDDKPVEAQWTDRGVFDCLVPLVGPGIHPLHLEVRRQFRQPARHELTVTVLGKPTLEFVEPTRDDDKTSASTYGIVVATDEWTTAVTARRGGTLLQEKLAPAGARQFRLEVPLQEGPNEILVEAVNAVGQGVPRTITVTRERGPVAPVGPPPVVPAGRPRIESVLVAFGDEPPRGFKGRCSVRSGARLIVQASDAEAKILHRGKELTEADLVVTTSSPLLRGKQADSVALTVRNAHGTSEEVKFLLQIDDTKPQIVVQAPRGPVAANTPFTCSGEWRDDSGVASITVNGMPATGATEKRTTGTWSVELPGIAGPVEYDVVVVDTAGNPASLRIKIDV